MEAAIGILQVMCLMLSSNGDCVTATQITDHLSDRQIQPLER